MSSSSSLSPFSDETEDEDRISACKSRTNYGWVVWIFCIRTSNSFVTRWLKSSQSSLTSVCFLIRSRKSWETFNNVNCGASEEKEGKSFIFLSTAVRCFSNDLCNLGRLNVINVFPKAEGSPTSPKPCSKAFHWVREPISEYPNDSGPGPHHNLVFSKNSHSCAPLSSHNISYCTWSVANCRVM